MPRECRKMVSAGIASFPCTVPVPDTVSEHAGPCSAIESPPSMARRRAWVESNDNPADRDAEQARVGAEARGRLAGHQGPAVGSSEAMDGAGEHPDIEAERAQAARDRGVVPSEPPFAGSPMVVSVVHMAPGSGEPMMPCCNKPMHDMSLQDTVTRDPEAVTCSGQVVADDALWVGVVDAVVLDSLRELHDEAIALGELIAELERARDAFVKRIEALRDKLGPVVG